MIHFCPRCHKKVIPPAFLKTANVKGNIKLKCADEKCKGVVVIKAKKKEVESEKTVQVE